MKKILLAISVLEFSMMTGCQTESLDIQRSFPFSLSLDAFPSSIARHQPESVGLSVRTPYITAGSGYRFSWQLAAPRKGVLLLDKQVIAPGQLTAIQPTTGLVLPDTLTYIPADSGQHQLTLRIVDGAGQRKDTTFVLTVQ